MKAIESESNLWATALIAFSLRINYPFQMHFLKIEFFFSFFMILIDNANLHT